MAALHQRWLVFPMGCLVAILPLFVAGCGDKQTGAAPPPVVKVIEVSRQNVPIILEFVGQVEPLEEVQVRARVSGQIIKRFVPGGQYVQKGRPLFQIDPQPYEMSVLDARAQQADSSAALSRTRQNLARLEKLMAVDAVPRMEYDNALAEEKQLVARLQSSDARLAKAELDLKETTILAPIEGQMDTTNLSIGNYVQQGTTVLVTLSSPDPILVRFSLSEGEYLRFVQMEPVKPEPERDKGIAGAPRGREFTLTQPEPANQEPDPEPLQIVLEDGGVYPHKGKVVQGDRGFSAGTGTLTLKAQFANPKGLLRPGMFARVRATTERRADAILVPQRAIQDLMGKAMVYVVGEAEKTEMRAVRTGVRIGRLWLVEEGLKSGERVIVDGNQKVRPGEVVKAELTSLEPYAKIDAK